MNEWQPIETAPTLPNSEFLAFDGEFIYLLNENNSLTDFTHWMPLPELPELPKKNHLCENHKWRCWRNGGELNLKHKGWGLCVYDGIIFCPICGEKA